MGGLTIVGVDALSDLEQGFVEIVADEVNVKDVRVLAEDDDEARSYGIEQRLTVNARAAGPRLGKDVQAAIKAVKAGEGVVNSDGTLTGYGGGLPRKQWLLQHEGAWPGG